MLPRELLAINEARLVLLQARARMALGWADRGSALDRGREVLTHAEAYLASQAEREKQWLRDIGQGQSRGRSI